MNITTATPVSLPVNTANVPTESVQTQNQLAERIPESRQTFESVANRAAETGPNNPTNTENTQRAEEEKPRVIGSSDEEQSEEQQSRGGEQSAEQEAQDQQEIRELSARDRQVKAHEQAHSSVGGSYAGSPSYTYRTGPNGVRYAVGGEVPIDISPASTPEATLRKAETVVRAALAPADPSPTDRRVAAAASALASKARYEIARLASEKAQTAAPVVQDGEEEAEQGPQPYEKAGTSLSGGMLSASLKTNATEQVGGQVSASA